MANTDRPHGFDPVGHIRAPHARDADPTGATAFFRGDIVNAVAAGYVQPAAATATDMVGSSVGYKAATSSGHIMIYDDPDQHFVAQTVTGTAPAQEILGNQCDHTAGTGSTRTLISGHELNIATTDASTGFGFLLLDFLQQDDNDTTVAHAEMICRIYEHHYAVAANIGV